MWQPVKASGRLSAVNSDEANSHSSLSASKQKSSLSPWAWQPITSVGAGAAVVVDVVVCAVADATAATAIRTTCFGNISDVARAGDRIKGSVLETRTR
jgi:hypothetical protein